MRESLKVSGMHCKSCETLLKEVAEEIPGVKVLRASYARGVVEVEVADAKRFAEVVNAIEGEGYPVKK